MQNLPPELIEEILKKQDSVKDIMQLCDSNSKNKSICENYFIHKIKRKFNTSVQIFAELFMKFNIIEIRYAGKTRFARSAASQSDSLIIKSHKVYGKNSFMKKFKYLLSEWLKYDNNAGTLFPNRPFLFLFLLIFFLHVVHPSLSFFCLFCFHKNSWKL